MEHETQKEGAMHKQNEQELQMLAEQQVFSQPQLELFKKYIELLEAWHKKTNLVSANDLPRIVGKHIRESLEILHHNLLNERQTILDAGSGAGFPGIPVSILYPDICMTLVDSRKVKTLFLQEAVDLLELKNVSVVCQRLEKIALPEFNNTCDLVLARAVTHLQELWKWTAPLLKPGGILVAYKGGDLSNEIADFQKKHPGIRVDAKPFISTPAQDEKVLVQVIKADIVKR